MRTTEFQKRGLPHAHILIILQERHAIKGAQQVDQILSAQQNDTRSSSQCELLFGTLFFCRSIISRRYAKKNKLPELVSKLEAAQISTRVSPKPHKTQ